MVTSVVPEVESNKKQKQTHRFFKTNLMVTIGEIIVGRDELGRWE